MVRVSVVKNFEFETDKFDKHFLNFFNSGNIHMVTMRPNYRTIGIPKVNV
jgi:hypothetical protein